LSVGKCIILRIKFLTRFKKNHPPFDIFSKLKEILKRFKEKINFCPTLYKVVVKAVSKPQFFHKLF
jgi:hypothetical protein